MSELWQNFDHYQLLELSRDATVEEIKSQRDLMLALWHPDRIPSKYSELATERTTRINDAYKTLSNHDDRQNYDLALPPVDEDVQVFPDAIQNVPGVWKAMAGWMKDEDVGTGFQRKMAFTAGDCLERQRQPSEKQLPYMTEAWELACSEGFRPEVDGLG